MSIIQSLSRGLTIVELLANSDKSLGVTEISKQLGVDKSSATRLIQTLVVHGFAIKDPESRRFLIGPKMKVLTEISTETVPLKMHSLPFLQELMEKTGENSHVAVFSRDQCLVVADIESAAQLRVVSGEGRLIPNHCTAIGKCLVAFGGYPIPLGLPSFTPRTITAVDQFRLHLDQIRNRGYAVDDEEHEFGVRCLAAPVYDETGRAVASMGISGPTVRVTLARVAELAEIVIAYAADLSEVLGYRGLSGELD